jgi:hypothetical protein
MKALIPILILFALALASCAHNQVGCAAADSVAVTTAGALAQALQCANPDAVKADIKAQIAKAGLCSGGAVVKTGTIAAIVCPTLASFAASVIPNIPPAAWGCTAQNAQATAAQLLTTGCEYLPF